MTWSDVAPDVAGAGHDVGDVEYAVEDVVIDIGDAFVENKKKAASLRLRPSLGWRGESGYAALANGSTCGCASACVGVGVG
jgi:hypothetical protein